MKKQWTIWWLVLAVITPSWAQFATSHSSTLAPKNANIAIPPAPAKPVARVNGALLTDHDLMREEYAIFPYARQHGGNIPKEMEPGIRKGAMEMIIFEELVYQEALRRKLTVPPATVQTAEAAFRKQFATPAEYQQLLKSEFQGSPRLLKEKVRRSLLIESLLKSEVNRKSTVTPAEVQAYYNKNPKLFSYPESFLIQTISFMPPAKATPQQMNEARKRAEAALPLAQAAKDDEKFGMLAEKVSEDDYRVMMGEHKPIERSKMAPQTLKALDAMQSGQVTGIIQVDQVYTIVRLHKHTPAGKTKLAEVKEQLKQELEKKKVNAVRAAFDQKLRQNAKIEVL